MEKVYLNEIYHKQVAEDVYKNKVKIMNEEVFLGVISSMFNELTYPRQEIEVPKLLNEVDHTIMFYHQSDQITLFENLVTLIDSKSIKGSVTDYYICLVDKTKLRPLRNGGFLVTTNPPVKSIPLYRQMFSYEGEKYLEVRIGHEILESPKKQPSLIEQMQSLTEEEKGRGVLSRLDTPSKEPVFGKSSPKSNVAEIVKQGVSSAIDAVATVKEKFKKQSELYIICEQKYIEEGKSVIVYHLYLDKEFYVTCLDYELPVTLRPMVEKGNLLITDMESIITKKDEWKPDKHL